jgi:hypothetical protein
MLRWRRLAARVSPRTAAGPWYLLKHPGNIPALFVATIKAIGRIGDEMSELSRAASVIQSHRDKVIAALQQKLDGLLALFCGQELLAMPLVYSNLIGG